MRRGKGRARVRTCWMDIPLNRPWTSNAVVRIGCFSFFGVVVDPLIRLSRIKTNNSLLEHAWSITEKYVVMGVGVGVGGGAQSRSCNARYSCHWMLKNMIAINN